MSILLESESIELPAGSVQPVWVTVAIPPDATAGEYRATLSLSATAKEEPIRTIEQGLTLHVFPLN